MVAVFHYAQSLVLLPHARMREGVKQLVLSVVTYVYLIGSKAVQYPLLFQQFPI